MNRTLRPALLFLPLCLASTSNAQGDPADIARIIQEGKHRNQVMSHLRYLTKKIGPRVTGSPKMYESQLWAVKMFKSFGIKNARLEKWGDLPVGFQRGARQVGRMVSPYNEPIVFSTSNWAAGTNGLVRGEAVLEPKTMEEFNRRKAELAGKWVVGARATGPRPDIDVKPEVRKAVDAAGILGRVAGSSDERVYSHGSFKDKSYTNRPKEVDIVVRRSDMDRILRNIQLGRQVVLEFDIENVWIKGPVPEYNVVADIVGTERPDEMIIIGGHLDSWNSPGSEGAVDNGTGAVVAIEAARILMKSGVKPKRTIRFVLWSGEEQGLLGSRAYVEIHRTEMDKVSAVLNDDGGTNYHGGYVGPKVMEEMMTRAFAPTVAAFPDMPMQYRVIESMRRSGASSDHAAFWVANVPGFFTIESGRGDYFKAWHTQFDRFEEAIPEYLVQSSTNHAVVGFNLAQAATLLPREPAPSSTGGSGQPTGYDRHIDEDDHAHDSDYWDYVETRFRMMLSYVARKTR